MHKNIRIVMVGTSHPGNIGAAARGMKTMSLDQLYLVAPKTFPHAEATARAAGADDILAKAQVVPTLEAALTDCRLVLGCSARNRCLSLPILNPHECARKSLETATYAPVAILFGNEQNGLSNAELEHCHFQVVIPSNSKFSSLNVAAAIQIISYEINMGAHDIPISLSTLPSLKEKNDLIATADDMVRFYAHLEQALIAVNFLDTRRPKKLMQRLHQFFNRAQPKTTEIHILRGILTAILKKIGSP